MNVTKVGSRECLIFGAGPMPKNEVTQVVKEFSVLSDRQVWSWLRLEEDRVPRSVMTQIESDAKSADLITYDVKLKDFPEWSAYGWEATSLTEVDEDDLVVLWLIEDDPTDAEISFARSVLDAGRQLLVMNDGLWQIDHFGDDGMYAAPEDEPEDIPDPAEDTNDYDSMDKETLKAEVVERRLKADKRSVEAMIVALIEDDVQRASGANNVLPFPTAPADAVGDSITDKQSTEANDALFGVTDEDNAPMVPDEAAPNDHDPLTDEEQQAQRPNLTNTVSTTQGEMPSDLVAYRSANAAVIELLDQAVAGLNEMAQTHGYQQTLSTQLARIMVELKKELSGDQPD